MDRRDVGAIMRERMRRTCLCPYCGEPIDPNEDFRDAASVREYMVSGICQGCQDRIFGERGQALGVGEGGEVRLLSKTLH